MSLYLTPLNVEWEQPSKPLKYSDFNNEEEDICMKMIKIFSQGEMELDCFTEALYPINTISLAGEEERF